MSEESKEIVELVAEEEHEGLRLDVFLAEVVEDATRSFLKKLIKDQHVRVNGQVCTKPARTMTPGETIGVEIPPPPPARPEPEDIPLDILYEDEDLVVVNKSSAMVVHPAPGHYSGTLVNALLGCCKDFERSGADMSRPGIVHRLDRQTSGVMVVAKNQKAMVHLSAQANAHTFDRHYVALVRGEFKEERGTVDASIGRSLSARGKMAVTPVKARAAVTHFEVIERFVVASYIQLKLETGRTHQIRVHMRFAGRQVLGDPLYGVTDFSGWAVPPDVRKHLEALQGQALHAERLGFTHPRTEERMNFTAPPPGDFQRALEALRGLQSGA
jgi:23S rRNA pseudouridine1911/1915/1917 synthase